MRRQVICGLVFAVVFAVATINFALAKEENMAMNKAISAKIRAFDRGFFKGFDVYSAGTQEKPSALLFDRKDNYTLASQLWGRPLKEDEIIYAIHRLDDQYVSGNIPFEPSALNIVNVKGEALGYVYTGMTYVMIDRKKDGQVMVYLTVPQQFGGNCNCGSEGAPDQ